MATCGPTKTLQCPICREDITDPRLLPCIHSFCLECLERYCRTENKLPGDDVPCPFCKTEFKLPKKGVAGLPVRTHTREADHAEEEFDRSIDEAIKPVLSRIESFRVAAAQVKLERKKLLDNIEAVEEQVKQRSKDVVKEFKQLVHRQESELLDKLQSLKSSAEDEVNSHEYELQLAMAELESFRTSSLELRSTISARNVTRSVKDVNIKAKQLLESYVIPAEYHTQLQVY